MHGSIRINKTIKKFSSKIEVSGDKSLSIRWLLLTSSAIGKSKAYNLLESEDVKSTIKALSNLGVKIRKNKNYIEVEGLGLNNFKIKKNCTINAGNSGTLARLILGMLAGSKNKVKIIGDKSLSKRDFGRVIKPLKEFGVNVASRNNKLPVVIKGTKFLRPIKYYEKIGSAQVKSMCCFSAMITNGTTEIIAAPSRNHTEILLKKIGIPIEIKSIKKLDVIKITGKKNYSAFDYKIPGDISSASFFIVLTLLSDKSKLLIRNVNINESRTGIIDCLKKMNSKIKVTNKRSYMGESLADIFIESTNNLRSINCPKSINSRAIDEMLLLFYVAAVSYGVSTFKNLGELNKKESRRLDWGFKILKMIGVRTKKIKNNGIKIFGNPKLKLHGNFKIINYFKDHRICMLSMIIALTKGGSWQIDDADSINTSFPSYLKIIKKLGAKFS